LSPTFKPDSKSAATAKALKLSATIAIEGTNIVFIDVSPLKKGKAAKYTLGDTSRPVNLFEAKS
jgi:hypothetical protein